MEAPGSIRTILAVTIAVLLVAPVLVSAQSTPSPSTHYRSLINWSLADPANTMVVVIPPAYVSTSAYLGDTGWVGPDAVVEAPGTAAVLEAIDYWRWALDHYAAQYPQAQAVQWTVKVVGYDATVADINNADILVTSVMANDPAPFVFHLGVGLPTLPLNAFLYGNAGVTLCTVWNTGAGSLASDIDPLRLRNLAIHEFGHCIAAGHTYGGNYEHLSSLGDVMAGARGHYRQCLSNLNVQSVNDAYLWWPGPWAPSPDFTYILKTDYEQVCMPSVLERF